MITQNNTLIYSRCFTLVAFFLLFFNHTHAAAEPNPISQYIVSGQAISPWHLVAGDPDNWSRKIEGGQGQSKRKKVIVSKTSHSTNDDAVLVEWTRKKGKGAFNLSGTKIDLSALGDDIALMIEMKVFGKYRSALSLSMDCEYPCRGTVHLRPLLKAYPINEWFILPIPLTCFTNAGTDLSKVSSPLHLETSGKYKLGIANVRLTSIPPDANFCAKGKK